MKAVRLAEVTQNLALEFRGGEGNYFDLGLIGIPQTLEMGQGSQGGEYIHMAMG